MGKRYGQEFRDEAVRLVADGGSLRQVALDLGVNVWTLRDWVRSHRESQATAPPGRRESLEEENTRLKRELALVRQERDILKKAAAYFAKEHL